MAMKIALAQINTKIGDFEGIVRKVANFVARARKAKVDLVTFPELTTTGYPPRDLVERANFVEKNLKALGRIAQLSKGIAIVVGFVGRNEQAGGKPLLNAAALCQEGKIVAQTAKNLLPTYDVFDETRYFEPGREALVYEALGKKIGLSICEDCWNDKYFWEKPLYPRDPIEEQVSRGADLLLNLSASPFTWGKDRLRREMLQATARRHQRPVFLVNLVGGNDELVFDGRSLAIHPSGEIVAEGKAFAEDLVVVELETMKRRDLKPIDDIESVYHALVLGVRDYVRKCGFKKVVLGLSGGIDSTLVAVIAADALGPDNVLGVGMPSPFSSKGSLEDAGKLAGNLKIPFKVYPIGRLYNGYRGLLGARKKIPDPADENIQARIRGNILMALSNRYGPMVLSTGNKSELAVGYCTLYGDMSGGLSVISDLPKTMVYELARWIQKKKRKVIPEAVFTKPPSAELRPNQTDQDSLPPYDILDPILKGYVEDHLSAEEIIKKGFDAETVEEVIRRVQQNEYKRRQAAPGIKITSKAFGIGRRYPIARES